MSEINAAIGGTGSDLGVFRLGHDVLQHEPDLVFVEFAVNDGGAPPERIWQAMEGIVRQTWAADSANRHLLRLHLPRRLREGPRRGPLPSGGLGHGDARRALWHPVDQRGPARGSSWKREGKLIFKSDEPAPEGVVRFSKDGVHPLDEGHQIYTDVIADAVVTMQKTLEADRPRDEARQPFVDDHWQAAKMVPIARGDALSGDWQRLPEDDPLAMRASADAWGHSGRRATGQQDHVLASAARRQSSTTCSAPTAGR